MGYRKGQKIKDIKTRKEQNKLLKEMRETRRAYPGGKRGHYTITVGKKKKTKKK